MPALLLMFLLVSTAQPAGARNRTVCDDVPANQTKLKQQGVAASRPFCASTNPAFNFETQAKRFLPVHQELMNSAELPGDVKQAVKKSFEMYRAGYDFLKARRDELCAEKTIDTAPLLRAVPTSALEALVLELDTVDKAVKQYVDHLEDDLGRFELQNLGRKNGFEMQGKIGAEGSRAIDALNANFHVDLGERLSQEVKNNLGSGVFAKNVSTTGELEPFGVFSAAVQAFDKEMNFFHAYTGATYDLRLCAKGSASR